jgi:hypothetical protein
MWALMAPDITAAGKKYSVTLTKQARQYLGKPVFFLGRIFLEICYTESK